MGWFFLFKRFVVEVWSELQKTTWPGFREVYGTTIVVIITVLICAAYLFVVDSFLQAGIDFIFEAAGR